MLALAVSVSSVVVGAGIGTAGWFISRGQLDVSRAQLKASESQTALAKAGHELSEQQARTAKHQVKFELYDKRYKIYDATKLFLNCATRDFKVSIDEVREFLRNTAEIDFLFGPELTQYASDVRGVALRLRANMMKLEHTERTGEAEIRQKLFAIDEELTAKLVELDSQLVSRFKPYLDLGNIT